MTKLPALLVLGIFLVFTHQTVNAQNIDNGKKLFEEKCAKCHGLIGEISDYGNTLKPFPAKDLRTNLLTYREMKFIIKYGLYRRAMTGKTDVLKDNDVDDIIAHIRTLKYDPDHKAGKKRYREVCSVCHGEDSKGKEWVHTPDLRESVLSKEEMAEIIRYGRHNTAMTPKRDVLTNIELANIIGYLMSIRK